MSATLLKKRLQHRCFPVSIAKFSRIPFLKNICKRLLEFVLKPFFSSENHDNQRRIQNTVKHLRRSFLRKYTYDNTVLTLFFISNKGKVIFLLFCAYFYGGSKCRFVGKNPSSSCNHNMT